MSHISNLKKITFTNSYFGECVGIINTNSGELLWLEPAQKKPEPCDGTIYRHDFSNYVPPSYSSPYPIHKHEYPIHKHKF
jgi:hypothetical protein